MPAGDNPDNPDDPEADPKPLFDPNAIPGDNPAAANKGPAIDIADSSSADVVDTEVNQVGLGNEPEKLGNEPS